jgi:transcriptional regulator with XRE-family HTH domain
LSQAARKADDEDLRVGARIRSRRRALKLSRRELAERAGVALQIVQKSEQGVIRVGARRLQSFAAALGVPVTYFFDEFAVSAESSEDKELQTLLTFIGTHEGLELNSAFSRIGDLTVRRAVVALVATISAARQSSAL